MPLKTVTPIPLRPSMGELPGIEERSNGRAKLGHYLRSGASQLYVLLQKVLDGKLNNTAEVTLAVDPATTTVFSDPRILASSTVLFSPTTSNAAASIANVYATAAQGSVTFTHDASADADRTFRIAVFA